MRLVVSIPKQAAEQAQENLKVAELKEELINAYPRLFSGVTNKNPPDRGRFGTARIKLKPNPKIYRHREYQLQGDRAEAMKKLSAEFIERGWIEPSDSEWASPAFIVPKKEKGEWRLVVDYRGLNEQTEHDSYLLPLIDTILQKQQKKRNFTVLDLKHGYHQMPLHADFRPCTVMSTPLGPMQWKVVPMGAQNGNAAFQRMMEDLLGPVWDCADPLVDDIIIGSGTEDMTEDELIQAHEKDLRRVLSELDIPVGGLATGRCGGHAQASRQAKHCAHRGFITLVSCDKAFQDPCHSETREQKYVQQHIRICTHGVRTGLG